MTTAAARFYETDLLLESGGKLRCFIDFLFFFHLLDTIHMSSEWEMKTEAVKEAH